MYCFIIIIVTELFICYYNRGTTFRKEFAELQVVRSLIPSGVNVMALTATATSTTRRSIIKILGMEKPLIISWSPSKENLFLSVKENSYKLLSNHF